jgi:hypothetical protein
MVLLSLFADSSRAFLTQAALFLIVGGLAILFLLVGLFLIQTLLPSSTEPLPLAAGKGKRRLRPVTGGALPTLSAPSATPPNFKIWRRRTRDESPVPRIDLALDRIVYEGLGEPRILRRLPNAFHLRLLRCRECASHSARADPEGECHAGRVRILEACRAIYGEAVRVHEIACRQRGNPDCDFEVVA